VVSRAAFYAWLNRLPTAREKRLESLTGDVIRVYERSRRRYGSPRVRSQLKRQGVPVSVKTVARIMRENGLVARRNRRFKCTTDSRNTRRLAPNLLKRNFVAQAPNEVWVTDVTALWTLRGWVYLAVMLDLFARRVVGWSLSETNDTALALRAFERAVATRRPRPGLIHHSDRGSPYGSDNYIAALKRAGCKRSMSRKGDCWDNAVAESFFATLEHECMRDEPLIDISHAERVVGAYIDRLSTGS
jgi:transposase InsO family protein